MPGRSIIRPTLIPERSVVSKCPSSIRMPAQVWHLLSVGGCSPRDNTQGQNTVQLHDKASSPLIVQLSVNARLLFLLSLTHLCGPMTGEGRKRNAAAGNHQRDANCLREAT